MSARLEVAHHAHAWHTLAPCVRDRSNRSRWVPSLIVCSRARQDDYAAKGPGATGQWSNAGNAAELCREVEAAHARGVLLGRRLHYATIRSITPLRERTMRRRKSLLASAARTAVVAGTAMKVSGNVARRQEAQNEVAARSNARASHAGGHRIEQLERLNELKKSGALTTREFETREGEAARGLSTSPHAPPALFGKCARAAKGAPQGALSHILNYRTPAASRTSRRRRWCRCHRIRRARRSRTG